MFFCHHFILLKYGVYFLFLCSVKQDGRLLWNGGEGTTEKWIKFIQPDLFQKMQ